MNGTESDVDSGYIRQKAPPWTPKVILCLPLVWFSLQSNMYDGDL